MERASINFNFDKKNKASKGFWNYLIQLGCQTTGIEKGCKINDFTARKSVYYTTTTLFGKEALI